MKPVKKSCDFGFHCFFFRVENQESNKFVVERWKMPLQRNKIEIHKFIIETKKKMYLKLACERAM